MSGKLYMIEMIVSNLEIIQLPNVEECLDMETCVLFRLLSDIEIELCDCDLGSMSELKGAKKGKNCLFPWNEKLMENAKATISVYKKNSDNSRILIGMYDMSVSEIFKKISGGAKKHKIRSSMLLKNQDENDDDVSETPESQDPNENFSVQSIKSFKDSTSVHTNSDSPWRTETIKGMFPLTNNENELVGWIVMILRFSCFGNTITQSIVVDTKSSEVKRPNLIVGVKTSSEGSDVQRLYHLSEYKKRRGKSFSSTSSSECEEPCPPCKPCIPKSDTCDEIVSVLSDTSNLCTLHPPSPIESCTRKPSETFDEYLCEINDNALIIRIAKDAHMTAQVLEAGAGDSAGDCFKEIIKCSKKDQKLMIEVPEDACGGMPTIHTYCSPSQPKLPPINCPYSKCPYTRCPMKKSCPYAKPNPDCPCATSYSSKCKQKRKPSSDGCHKLPIVKGNLKYPNKSCTFNVDVNPGCNNMEKYRIGNEKERNICIQTCQYDIAKERGYEHKKSISGQQGMVRMSKVIEPSVVGKEDDKKNGNEIDDSKGKKKNEKNQEKSKAVKEGAIPDLEKLKAQCPPGIEMYRKGWHDPDTDVFVLKLGQKKPLSIGGGTVELELRTPKCPDLEPKPKNTVAVQVIEEEFEDYKVSENINGKPKGKKGAKGKGKGKKK